MMWKIIFVVAMAAGALAEYQVTDEQRQQVRAMLTQVCKRNGAEDKVDEVEKGVKDFAECVKALINPEEVRKEIEEAKPNGALDEVFKKYCAKSPQLKTCISSVINVGSPCMDAAVREHVPHITNATSSMIDFVCYKDGDRIALFIAEGGPECIQQKSNTIRECLDTAKSGVPDVEAAKKLTVQEQCAKYDALSACMVTALEGCNTPTPGNMAESVFKFIRKNLPCVGDEMNN